MYVWLRELALKRTSRRLWRQVVRAEECCDSILLFIIFQSRNTVKEKTVQWCQVSQFCCCWRKVTWEEDMNGALTFIFPSAIWIWASFGLALLGKRQTLKGRFLKDAVSSKWLPELAASSCLFCFYISAMTSLFILLFCFFVFPKK